MKKIWLAAEDTLTVTMKNLQKLSTVQKKTIVIQALIILGFLYLTFSTVKIPITFESTFDELSSTTHTQKHLSTRRHGNLPIHARLNIPTSAPTRPEKRVAHASFSRLALRRATEDWDLARTALAAGKRLWSEAESESEGPGPEVVSGGECPGSVTVTGAGGGQVAEIPCGMRVGSSVTVVGRARGAEFRVELVGLRAAEGEEPPTVLHMNPRLRGDWSGKPVIEINTCYRMHWGSALRCDGWPSPPDEETVDGQAKCEKWILGNNTSSEEAKTKWWLNKLIGSRTKKLVFEWPFPFTQDKLFVLTISARLEGYHINVDGRHVASFPYRTGFTLEDATGVSVKGEVEVHSVFVASLPSVHPSLAQRRSLDMSGEWRAPRVPEKGGVELFIGVLSAGNHFTERMAMRKSWMSHNLIRSSLVVARFFVALHARKAVNALLKKEAEFFGDIVIVPYLDNYDLVVLKTIAICDHGLRSISAKKVMKCDDDTFVNLDAVLGEAMKIPEGESFYVGNINTYLKPFRSGKWAVTQEEWPEALYPPYANGPGYIISSDIANFTVSEFERNKLRLFKMEDVSMGMWVKKFNETRPVKYVHSLKFCQFGCIEDYFTAHDQSPRQMTCMWEKFQRGTRPQCCDMR